MIIICETNNLNKAIQTVQKAIISKPSTPIFSGIHIIAKNNKVILQAMDLNMAISCTIEAEVETEGEAVVSAKHFAELVRKLSSEQIRIVKNNDSRDITVESGKSEFKLLLMNENDYPKFPEFDGDKCIEIEDEKIRELIRKTIFACSSDESRPLFTGILMEVLNGKMTFVGTNTHRLAIKSVDLNDDQEPISIIIPSKVLTEILRNLSGEIPQNVKISLLGNQIMVNIGSVVIVSRLIEGKFPDYRKVIPPKFAVKTVVDIKELAAAVERVSLFSSDSSYSIVKMNVSGNEVNLTSSSPEVGTGLEVIPCETEGDGINVALNSKYVLDVLKNLESENVTLYMNTALSPVCVKSGNEDNYTYIVTPVRVVF